jgi:hypothetical protein
MHGGRSFNNAKMGSRRQRRPGHNFQALDLPGARIGADKKTGSGGMKQTITPRYTRRFGRPAVSRRRRRSG